MPLRIGIDARFYGPEAKGLGRYVEKLLAHLPRVASDHSFTVFLLPENSSAYTPPDERFVTIVAPYSWYTFAEQLGFARLLRRERLDLLHFPHYNVPLLYRRPFVVTVHDLILSRYPTVRASTLHPALFRLKHRAYSWVIRSAIRRSRHILTVSNSTKTLLTKTYGVPNEKVTVTYLAADPICVTTPETKNRFSDNVPYLLYVGNAYPHKNIEGLLQAFALLRQKYAKPIRLVLVGKNDYFFERIRRLSAELGVARDVVFTGYVTDDELGALYKHAMLYVFPSFEEGFGLPPLEAMHFGVPVASSNRSCLPEVLGNAAEYFSPEEPEEITRTLLFLLERPERRRELALFGKERVRQFRWDTLARKTLDVYTNAARQP